MHSKSHWLNAILFIAVTSFQACSVVGGIFKAGVWVGVVAVIFVVLLIIFLVSKASGKK
ncbi:MAG TPA: phosphatidate cytidylyltransferase [Puia sp.]